MIIYRQGDVALIRRDDLTPNNLPAGARRLNYNPGEPIVLAEGEVTGHSHTILAGKGIQAYSYPDTTTNTVDAGTLLLMAEVEVLLRHQEHDTITVAPGIYQVIRQREYTPEAIRNVAD